MLSFFQTFAIATSLGIKIITILKKCRETPLKVGRVNLSNCLNPKFISFKSLLV